MQIYGNYEALPRHKSHQAWRSCSPEGQDYQAWSGRFHISRFKGATEPVGQRTRSYQGQSQQGCPERLHTDSEAENRQPPVPADLRGQADEDDRPADKEPHRRPPQSKG